MAQELGFEADLARWRQVREQIKHFLLHDCVHSEKQYFVQSPERQVADASALLIPIMHFLPAADLRVQNTIDQILVQLSVGGHLRRYNGADGLRGQEGAFNICTFWLVEALAMSGRVAEASDYFVKALESAGLCGLFSEETEPVTGRALGNYPQAFSHIGLINAALALNQSVKKERETQSGPSPCI